MDRKQEKATKRGRPAMSEKKKAEMRFQISVVANKLFKTEGFKTVSMRRIAKEIGCTPMSLYRYYDSKIDLLRSLWSDVFADLFSKLENASASNQSHERLLKLGIAYVDFWLDNPDSYRLVFMAEGVSQPDVSLFLDNPDIVEKFSIFQRAILIANPQGLSDKTLKLRFDVFLSTLHGITHNQITISGYPWSHPREQIEVLIPIICGGERKT